MGLDGKPRELHIKASLEAIDFSCPVPVAVKSVENPYFRVSEHTVDGRMGGVSDPQAFCVYTCMEGTLRVTTPDTDAEVLPGRSVFMPAGLGSYEWHGKGTLLKSRVP
jgi:mannose-6-phosphate isomerase